MTLWWGNLQCLLRAARNCVRGRVIFSAESRHSSWKMLPFSPEMVIVSLRSFNVYSFKLKSTKGSIVETRSRYAMCRGGKWKAGLIGVWVDPVKDEEWKMFVAIQLMSQLAARMSNRAVAVTFADEISTNYLPEPMAFTARVKQNEIASICDTKNLMRFIYHNIIWYQIFHYEMYRS